MPRLAELADLSNIAALYHSVWHETHARFMPLAERQRRTLEFFLDRMRPLLPATFIENHRGIAPAGFVSWQGGMLGQLYVAQGSRGTHVAADLLSASELAIAAGGYMEAELHCLVGNQRAHRFYERSGWSTRDEVVENVQGETGLVGVPFWRMTKRLKGRTCP
jgi:GNAT superfamily N-acetyltransferase